MNEHPERMTSLVMASHTLAFALEIALVVAFVRAGMMLGGETPWRWVLGTAGGLLVVGLWWRLAAPKSKTRLVMPAILVFKVIVFAVGTTLLMWTGPIWLALAFGALAMLHLALAVQIRAV
jgi:hypothetical protein